MKKLKKEIALNWLAMDSPLESRQDNKELVSAKIEKISIPSKKISKKLQRLTIIGLGW